MPARVEAQYLAACPEPGTPHGIWTEYDRAMWLGADREWVLSTVLCTMRLPGGKSARFHVVGKGDQSEILASAKNTDGLDSHQRAQIRHWQDGETDYEFRMRLAQRPGSPPYRMVPMSGRQIVCAFIREGAEMTYEDSEYCGSTKIKAICRAAYEAGVMLSQLVGHFDGDGRMRIFEKKTSGGTDRVDRVSVGLLLPTLPDPYERVQWFDGLSDDDRKIMAGEILRESGRVVRDPPPWPWWAGSQQRAQHFVERSSFNDRRQPRPTVSWKLKGSMLRTLAKRWLSADSHVAERAGLGYTQEQQLQLVNQGML